MSREESVRILITEDDDALAEALQFALTQAGYAVDRVANGAAADEALKDDVFGLLILDLGLPKLDGFEVLQAPAPAQTTAARADPVGPREARGKGDWGSISAPTTTSSSLSA